MIVNIYTCWVPLVVKTHLDDLTAGMVKKGYCVGPASGDGTLSLGNDSQPSFLLSFTVYKTSGEITAQNIYDDVLSILTEKKACFYAIIIAQAYDCTWTGCNFNIPEKKSVPPPVPPNRKLN